jgi:hypothetical protein
LCCILTLFFIYTVWIVGSLFFPAQQDKMAGPDNQEERLALFWYVSLGELKNCSKDIEGSHFFCFDCQPSTMSSLGCLFLELAPDLDLCPIKVQHMSSNKNNWPLLPWIY